MYFSQIYVKTCIFYKNIFPKCVLQKYICHKFVFKSYFFTNKFLNGVFFSNLCLEMYFSQIYLSICFVYKLICRMCIFHKFMFKSVILHFCLQMFFFLTKCKFDSISFLYFGPWDWVQKFSRMYLFLLKFGTFIECYFILLGLGAKAL